MPGNVLDHMTKAERPLVLRWTLWDGGPSMPRVCPPLARPWSQRVMLSMRLWLELCAGTPPPGWQTASN